MEYEIIYLVIQNILIIVNKFIDKNCLDRIISTDCMKYFQFCLLHLELMSIGIWNHVENYYHANHFGKRLLLFRHLEKCNL